MHRLVNAVKMSRHIKLDDTTTKACHKHSPKITGMQCLLYFSHGAAQGDPGKH